MKIHWKTLSHKVALNKKINSWENNFPTKIDRQIFYHECAGGLASGLGVRTCAVKECEEEASVPTYLTDKLKGVGCVRWLSKY
jgi:hypothetical protein